MKTSLVPVTEVQPNDVVVGAGAWRGKVLCVERDGDLYSVVTDRGTVGPMTCAYYIEIVQA